MSHSVRPTPGWYADPSDSQLLRWWNGTEWSDHTQPMPSRPVLVQEAPQDAISVRNDLPTAEPASPPPADVVPSSAEPKPKRRRAWMWVFLVVLIAALAGGGWYVWQREQTEVPTATQDSSQAAPAPVAPADVAVPGACTDVVAALTADGTSSQLATQLQGVAAGADLADTAGFLSSIGPVTGDLMANSGAACVAAVNAGQGPAAYAVFVNAFQAAMTGGTEIVNAGLAQPGGLTPEQRASLSAQAADLSAATTAVAKDAPVAPTGPPAG